MQLDFQKRAQRLKALAMYLMERKEELYEISHLTGATRPDSWVDVEGGIGTLFAYASMGSRELPSSNVLHEGPAIALGKRGGFAGTHILVPRGGVAVHINAFNFPIWGLLEKFAPSFLAAMPCIAKPATATSYLTHAVVKMMMESGLVPEGSLQLVIGSTGDLLDRLTGFDAVTFTGSADTAAKLRANANLIREAVPFTAEADSLNCAILAPDVTPGRRGVRPVRQGSRARDDRQGRPEVHGDPPRDRAGAVRRCGGRAPARAPEPRSWSATRRSRACAWARWPRWTSTATSASASRCSRAAMRCCSAPATVSIRWAKTAAAAPSSRRR
jgi:hypothetical protein